MTVKEMFETKYKEYMKTISHKAWENASPSNTGKLVTTSAERKITYENH